MKKINIALLITLSGLLSSCSWIYYVPNKQNVTLFQEKNEVELNMAGSAGQQSGGMEASAAVSVTDHFAIQGNFSFWAAIDQSLGQLYEIAPGYYTGIGQNFVFETYAGIGQGRSIYTLEKFDPYFPDNVEVNYDRYFVQPAIGYTSNNFDFAFSTRVCMVDYYHNKPATLRIENEGDLLLEKVNQFFTIDPAMTIRFGFKNFKFQLQGMYLFPLQSKYANSIFYERVNVNFGCQINLGGHFNPKWKKKVSSEDFNE